MENKEKKIKLKKNKEKKMQSHPLIPNSNEYMYERKYVSIHSDDINKLKYPNSSDFEIELPQDYCNVQSVQMSSWLFPTNVNTFTEKLSNVTIPFTINQPYSPSPTLSGDINYANWISVNEALTAKYTSSFPEFVVKITEGIYNQSDIVYELTNRFNLVVTTYLKSYFTQTSNTSALTWITDNPYTEFVITSCPISEIFFFGNQSSGFVITNNMSILFDQMNCVATNGYIDPNIFWGLPMNLGLQLLPTDSIPSIDENDTRFFNFPGTTGSWLTPSTIYPTETMYYIKAQNKWNQLIGKFVFYIEIDKLNSMDETKPFTDTRFTKTTNQTNGVVNSAFAKLPIYINPNNPIDNYYYSSTPADNVIRVFNPPMMRIRRLKITMRYHFGQYVDFNGLPFTFTLCFNILHPQNPSNYKVYRPESV